MNKGNDRKVTKKLHVKASTYIVSQKLAQFFIT